MAEFRMLVGIPGCGKSTYSKQTQFKNYKVHSSDEIRQEFNIFGSEHNNEVFKIMNERTVNDLKANRDVIYDATNISRKSRKQILDLIKSIDCEKVCFIFLTPIDICKDRNALRTGEARVPDYVYDRMLKAFNVPMLEEGFDHIYPIYYSEKYYFTMPDTDIDQDNIHHKLSLHDHMTMTYQYIKAKSDNHALLTAAKYHDIGKVYTKSYTNHKGEPSDHAHYYGHENYGAYQYLIYWASLVCNYINSDDKVFFPEVLHIAQLINWHMAPLNRWKSEKTLTKDKNNYISETFYDEIMLLHEADLAAH